MTRKIEITAISAENLVDGRKPVKKNAFVVFDMTEKYWKQSMRTSLDEVGGNYPMWEDKLDSEFSSEAHERSVMYVQVFCRDSGKDKHVGTARVPVKVFTGEYAPEGFLHCLSYRLWKDSRRNGIINFSVKIVPQKSDSKSGLPLFWLR